MVETGHGEDGGTFGDAIDDVIDIAYANPDRRHTGLEVLTFDTLKSRLKSEVSRRPSRLDFHQIMIVRGGEGVAMVDFATVPCVRGTLLYLRPGQVQRLPTNCGPTALDAVLLLFTTDFAAPSAATRRALDGFGPPAWQLAPEQFDAYDRAGAELEAEYRALLEDGGTDAELISALLRHLLSALLIRIARLPDPTGRPAPDAPGAEVYLAFRRALEDSFAITRSVQDYAAQLGYSPRTLTRACLAATGRTAKQLADARTVLQAQRLLAHTDQPVAAIGRALGFTEATNFGKFFARHTGRAPGDFRRTQR